MTGADLQAWTLWGQGELDEVYWHVSEANTKGEGTEPRRFSSEAKSEGTDDLKTETEGEAWRNWKVSQRRSLKAKPKTSPNQGKAQKAERGNRLKPKANLNERSEIHCEVERQAKAKPIRSLFKSQQAKPSRKASDTHIYMRQASLRGSQRCMFSEVANTASQASLPVFHIPALNVFKHEAIRWTQV